MHSTLSHCKPIAAQTRSERVWQFHCKIVREVITILSFASQRTSICMYLNVCTQYSLKRSWKYYIESIREEHRETRPAMPDRSWPSYSRWQFSLRSDNEMHVRYRNARKKLVSYESSRKEKMKKGTQRNTRHLMARGRSAVDLSLRGSWLEKQNLSSNAALSLLPYILLKQIYIAYVPFIRFALIETCHVSIKSFILTDAVWEISRDFISWNFIEF